MGAFLRDDCNLIENYPEALEVRNKLLSLFNELEFNEESHTYWVDGVKYPSVSSLLKNFYDDFSENITMGYCRKMGFDIDDVDDAWIGEGDIANNTGHRVHLFGENYVNWRWFGIGERPKLNCKQELGVLQFWNDIETMPDKKDRFIPVFTELRMFSKKYKYAGTADIICWDLKYKKLVIMDYKGLPLDTPILTQNGWKTMGTLNINDKLFDKNGNMVNICAISNIHYNPCYKMKLDNNVEFIVDHEHKWEVSFKRQGKYITKIMSTFEISEYLEYSKKTSYHLPRIKVSKPIIQQLNTKLPIDPYVLGLWLADGSKSCGIITNMNNDTWNEVKKRGYDISHYLNNETRCRMHTIYGLYKELRLLKLINNKHIPDIYLLSSYEQRLDLLRGFMDGDGYYNKKRKRFVMATTQDWQVEAMVKLVSSLGWKVSVLNCNKYLNGNIFKGYDICFTTNKVNPFLTRNFEVSFPTQDNLSSYIIMSVTPTEVIPTRCIEVDSESHTFLFGHNFITTHNTNKELTSPFKIEALRIGKETGLLQDNLSKYQLQFSFYRILLEEAGFDVGGQILIWLREQERDENRKKNLYKSIITKNFGEILRKFLIENKMGLK